MRYRTAYNVLSDYRKFITYDNIPEYALSYLVNDDPSGLEEEDIKNIDEFIEREELGACVDWGEEASFTSRPAFGLATDCVEATFEYLGK